MQIDVPGPGRRFDTAIVRKRQRRLEGLDRLSLTARGPTTGKVAADFADLGGIPDGSRATQLGSLSPNLLSNEGLSSVRGPNEIARGRGQTLAPMALA